MVDLTSQVWMKSYKKQLSSKMETFSLIERHKTKSINYTKNCRSCLANENRDGVETDKGRQKLRYFKVS